MTSNVTKPHENGDSEMEEGEIVDDLDDLSDISSEEEFLLRQRLEVLENYNNVLERKKAKRSSIGSGVRHSRDVLCDLSDISAAEFEDSQIRNTHKARPTKYDKYSKPKKRKEVPNDEHFTKKKKEHKKKTTKTKKRFAVKIVSESNGESEDECKIKRKKLMNETVVHRVEDNKNKTTMNKIVVHREGDSKNNTTIKAVTEFSQELQDKYRNRRKKLVNDIVHRGNDKKNETAVRAVSESSEESEDEYRNKRKKLAHAVVVYRGNDIKNDTTSLSARLKKMLHANEIVPVIDQITTDDKLEMETKLSDKEDKLHEPQISPLVEPIEISTDDDDVKLVSNEPQIEVNIAAVEVNESVDKDSDEDLELLRQHALKTKTGKTPKLTEDVQQSNSSEQNKVNSEDEDSDTAELRIICLKSALLKKAIEMKQKQKLQKRLSQSTMDDGLFNDCNLLSNDKEDSDNNTDIESVDMEIGSDAEDKLKDNIEEHHNDNNEEFNQKAGMLDAKNNNNSNSAKEDEIEEDEDLLRAKLLTSLSKNLPKLVSPEILKTIESDNVENKVPEPKNPSTKVPEEKRFIIKLDESDSEGEHEATKNLTKMHIKLSEQIDFQQKLDMFLKSTRLQVEKTKLPDVVQQEPVLKKPEKFVAKAVNHLPKSEQIEYKNLVRRMAELEKIKQSRQAAMNAINKIPVKETLKPRNVTIEAAKVVNINIEEEITLSRKKIAEESAKMLKLKEEATKLSQKYKIVATELRNISTAITLNKKQQRTVQNCLSKIRLQHQSLLKSSTNSLHSKVNGRIPNFNTKLVSSNKLQKENNPKDEYKNPLAQKTVKVSVVNNFKPEPVTATKLSVQVDTMNNKKVVRVSKSPEKERKALVHGNENEMESINRIQSTVISDGPSLSIQEKEERIDTEKVQSCNGSKRHLSSDDYQSPLGALGATTWKADPNAILCPFEVGGQCKDTDCKYLHTQTQ